jgi:excisionase family DNA binding protein
MTHSRHLRDIARLLRVERQLTVDQLAKRLALPRSTVYYWVRDLPLRASRSGVEAGGEPGARPDAASDAPSRTGESAYEEGLRSYDELVAQPTFRDFVCVYIVEGYKRDRRRVALANADPTVMRLAHRWIWRLTDKSPSLAVHCSAEQSSSELRRFWSETIGEETAAIRARRTGDGELLHRWSPLPVHGVLAVTVDDSQLRARLQAWMCRTRESWR